jgi:phosphosulfolactate phosphohydrolase-like enzyme
VACIQTRTARRCSRCRCRSWCRDRAYVRHRLDPGERGQVPADARDRRDRRLPGHDGDRHGSRPRPPDLPRGNDHRGDGNRRLNDPLLAGEQAGIKPPGFHLNNSPVAISRLGDCRAIVHVTSAGTQLLSQARGASSIYVACLRNLSATARQLAGSHDRVALIGAGTNGLPRPEDQYACARIGEALLAAGYTAENSHTEAELALWRGVPVEELRNGPSADFLRRTDQTEDLDYVLTHIDDLDAAAVFNGQQVSLLLPAVQPALAAEA